MNHIAESVPESVCMEALQLAGKIIMENGGETYRAEETIARMGKGFGLEDVESFAVPSGLFISCRGENGNPVTSVKRVRRLDRNLSRVNEVNQVSRLVFTGKMSGVQALARLREIETMPGSFRGWWSLPAAFLCACGFTALFGGNWISTAAAGVAAAFVQAAEMILGRFRSRGLAASVLGGLLTALLPHLLALAVPSLQTELVIAGAVMPLVPSDRRRRAACHGADADHHGRCCMMLAEEILRALFGAFFGVVGFAMLVHVPRRSWFVSGLVAAFSYLVYWAFLRIGLSDPTSIFIGSLLGSLAGQLCARKMRMIGTVFLMSAVVPVVPGLGLYRMMAFLGQNRIADGADMGIRAMITVAMIALGLGAGALIDRILHSRSLKDHHI